jgi:peptidoglycan LD-endopeptidase CwlK
MADGFVMDPGSEAMLELVAPSLAGKIRQVAEMCDLASETVRVIAGFRAWLAQERLWEQGRIVGGAIVTDARPGASWHEFGMAVDLGIIRLLAEPGWAPNDPAWIKLGNMGKTVGLFWGGDFQHNPDRPHFQLTGKFPISPNDEVRQILQTQGVSAVWQEAGI